MREYKILYLDKEDNLMSSIFSGHSLLCVLWEFYSVNGMMEIVLIEKT